MLKFSRGLNSKIFNELLQFREQIPYELRQRCQFEIPWVHSNFSGTESLDTKVWALVANKMKQLESLGKFTNTIK